MAKPSIFSRDYERIMKRRKKRRNISICFGILALIIGITVMKYDMQKISATFKNIAFNKELRLNNEKIESVNVMLNDNNIILKFIKGNDIDKIIDIESDDEIRSIDINKDKALIIDRNQNLYLINTKKEVIDLTLNEYITQNNEKISKIEGLSSNPNYMWHDQGKIVDDEKIVYITNIPTLNEDLKQCVSIVTINNNIHTIKEDFQGYYINLYEINDNGIKVEIDGDIRYITSEE